MKRKIVLIILLVALAVICLGLLASCKNKTVDYFNYSASKLGVMGKLVKWMRSWLPTYGWTVVVFTVFLKLVTLPLDLWQRISTRKSTLKMQKIQPLMAEIDKRYGANTQRANMEKQKLYKKQGYSALSSCLPMIVTMVIFFIMFNGLRTYSTYNTVTTFKELSATYFDSYVNTVKNTDGAETEYNKLRENLVLKLGEEEVLLIESDENYLMKNYTEKNVTGYIYAISEMENDAATDSEKCALFNTTALEAVSVYYDNNHESWLWIKNVSQPDTWAPIMPKYSGTNGFVSSVKMDSFSIDKGEGHYNAIRNAVINSSSGGWGKNGSWNGLMLLPVLSIGLSFLSIFVSQRMDKKSRKGEEAPAQTSQQKATNKTMMILMPLMMAFFGFMYTGAFAIYMVCNYALSILSTIAMRWPVEKIVAKSLDKMEKKESGKPKANYMR